MIRSAIVLSLLAVLGVLAAAAPWNAPIPKNQAALLHPIERVAFSDDWRHRTHRRARIGEMVFVILRTSLNSCEPVVASAEGITFWQMLPLNIEVGSDENARTGLYHEALVPRTPAVCGKSRYVLAEWSVSDAREERFFVGDREMSVEVTVDPSSASSRPFFVGLNVASLLKAHCGSEYCPRERELGNAYAALLTTHNLQPIQNWVIAPPIVDGRLDLDHGSQKGYSFRQTAFRNAVSGWIGFPRARLYKDPIAYLKALEKTVRAHGLAGKAWVYAADEPTDIEALAVELSQYKAYAPSVKIMVTTNPTEKLDGLVDIFAPVFNLLGPTTKERHYDLWTYMSCMGSCGPNRAARPFAEKVPGPDTALPDLLVDRPPNALTTSSKWLRKGGWKACSTMRRQKDTD